MPFFKDIFTPGHLIILVLVLILVFGSAKLPQLARNLGRSARIVKSEIDEIKTEGKAGHAEKVTPEPVTKTVVEPVVVVKDTSATEPKA